MDCCASKRHEKQPYSQELRQIPLCHPGDLWPHDPISGMSPKDRLAKVTSIPDILLTVSQAGFALGISPISWVFLSRQ